ncbi:MAG: peptidoglycan DD-metalloendopeptidase family protein [Anaerolineae bacterium]|nr:peptidoglycan DD-metalloendopeptidase family protein [Anaerolineae bacterium]
MHDDENQDPLAIEEPLFDPEDTPARGTPRPTPTPPHGVRTPPRTNPRLKRAAPPARRKSGPWGVLMLVGAMIITVVAGVLYLQSPDSVPAPTAVANATRQPPTAPPSVTADLPTVTPVPPTETPAPVVSAPVVADEQGVPPDVLAVLLEKPGQTTPPMGAFYRMQNAFTVAPARSRAGVIEYSIQPGDTLKVIAERFGISEDTLVWNNDGIYVNRLQIGDVLTILPENGVLHRTEGEETIQSIADKYKVSAYTIIDSEYNPVLRNASPSTLLPPGIRIMVPGGTGTRQAVYWNPGITVSSGSGSGGGGGTASFGGGPGSCGSQTVVGGTGSLVVPLPPNYVFYQGYTAYHTGVDLSAPIGTTVFAADGGTVIFAGWSNWGYGYSVVIAHGRLMTLYGHMDRVSVSCGQQVGRGAPIGTVGNSGNSSGPHLHFEVRIGEAPDNPSNYLAF